MNVRVERAVKDVTEEDQDGGYDVEEDNPEAMSIDLSITLERSITLPKAFTLHYRQCSL